jgi:glutamyl-Q tRNA(Asp) synthetase
MMLTTRFAPSPTGYLHLGHAYSALTAYQVARAAQGRFFLRIEDIDTIRCKPIYEEAIYNDLAWLGLCWESEVIRQSQNMTAYQGVLSQLSSLGLTYRCFKTRKDLMSEAAGAPHSWPEAVRSGPLPLSEEQERIGRGEPFAVRLWLDRCREHLGPVWSELEFQADGVWIRADPERLGDVVIARKDLPTSYHLASVHDDAAQGITHVVRGEDLADAPHLHVLLQALLDYPVPTFQHHRLILGADGKRLAKRDQAVTLQSLRQGGAALRDIYALIGLKDEFL